MKARTSVNAWGLSSKANNKKDKIVDQAGHDPYVSVGYAPCRRRGGRVAEGAPLLREYRVYSPIEGSNPSLSAKDTKIRARSSAG